MIHPSYNELIGIINKNRKPGEPEIESRYSLVIAAARRARQLVNEQEPLAEKVNTCKPLSIAVEEIREGKIHITRQGEDAVISYGDHPVREYAFSDQEGDYDGTEELGEEYQDPEDVERRLWPEDASDEDNDDDSDDDEESKNDDDE